ncbi:MAG: transposase [Sphingobium sp.]|nr:transposase [Sphingobium sp.]MBP6111533.1 transposase [Sphingobium sp.]MBP8670538.1 transposase [Sphingobium sp.]MBP9157265.1 transposase [Sphingobium sp.]MCC6482777.1 transposase [Sphingomonadaceae bacterium]
MFAPEFKRETVALFESSGRPLAHIAAEVGIMPWMLRAWRRSIRSGPLWKCRLMAITRGASDRKAWASLPTRSCWAT